MPATRSPSLTVLARTRARGRARSWFAPVSLTVTSFTYARVTSVARVTNESARWKQSRPHTGRRDLQRTLGDTHAGRLQAGAGGRRRLRDRDRRAGPRRQCAALP